MKTQKFIFLAIVLAVLVAMPAGALEGPELYPGEEALYEAAAKEGMVVSFDTGPTWANWGTMFKRFKKRYPDVEMAYNDLGSGATVVALEKARNRPQADTAYYFAGSAVTASEKGLLAPFQPVNFKKLPEVYRHPQGEWFVIHQLTIAFLVNTNLVKNIPQSWQDLLSGSSAGFLLRPRPYDIEPAGRGCGHAVPFRHLLSRRPAESHRRSAH